MIYGHAYRKRWCATGYRNAMMMRVVFKTTAIPSCVCSKHQIWLQCMVNVLTFRFRFGFERFWPDIRSFVPVSSGGDWEFSLCKKGSIILKGVIMSRTKQRIYPSKSAWYSTNGSCKTNIEHGYVGMRHLYSQMSLCYPSFRYTAHFRNVKLGWPKYNCWHLRHAYI